MLCHLAYTGESGPPHLKQFEYSVVVRGWEFTGYGSTKKAAKASAAEAALQYLNNTVNVGPHGQGVPGSGNPSGRSRADELGMVIICALNLVKYQFFSHQWLVEYYVHVGMEPT